MQYWIEYIIGNTSACEDFLKWIDSAEQTLNKALYDAVQSNDMDQARGIAHEIKVYENLRRAVKKNHRERVAQASYQEQIERRTH